MKAVHAAGAVLAILSLAFIQPAMAQRSDEDKCTIEPLAGDALSAEGVERLNENFRCIERRLKRLSAAAKGPAKKYGMLRTEAVDHLIVALESVRFSDDHSRVISNWTIRNTRQQPTHVMIDRFKSSISMQGMKEAKSPKIQDLAACDISYVDSTEQCARRKPDRWTVVQPGSWDSFRIVTPGGLEAIEARPVSFKVRFIVRKSKDDWLFRDVRFDEVAPQG